MELIEYSGSLLDSFAQILVHQVNCQCTMGSGLAKIIKDRYPVVFQEYIEFSNSFEVAYQRLGEINIVKISRKQAVCNLFGQFKYGSDGKRYTSYDALVDGFTKLRDFCVEKGVKSIAIPKNIGCGLGGGDWNIVYAIICSVFEETLLRIEICEYHEKI